jgi:hypothetical protein
MLLKSSGVSIDLVTSSRVTLNAATHIVRDGDGVRADPKNGSHFRDDRHRRQWRTGYN